MRVAIVGHGRSPEGRGWGPEIDRCDTVIRMWDWHWQALPDYGERYDYGLIEAAPSLIRAFNTHRQRLPLIGYIASALSGWERCTVPDGTPILHQKRWNEIGKAMGGIGATGRLQFTRGTIAACWAIEALCGVGDSIVLIGFDNVHAGRALPVEQGFSPEYRKAPGTSTFNGYIENAQRYGNHDFAVEGPVMEYLCERHGVRLEFSQDIWS